MKGKDTIKTQWGKVLLLSLVHIGALSALFFFSWQMLVLAIACWIVYGMFGICIGYHRLLTHRSFKTRRPVEYLLSVCGCLGLHGGSIQWATTHSEEHHRYSDKPGDPHSPRDGWFWSYLGWTIFKDLKRETPKCLGKNVQRLQNDRVHVWLNDHFWVPSVLLGSVLFMLGGYAAVAWGIFVPVVFGWHPTWTVNFVCHKWGSRRFDTPDNSRNNWWVALITFGEGWHNNHHGKQSSARHGFAWYEFDPSWYAIRVLKFCGIVWAIVPPR